MKKISFSIVCSLFLLMACEKKREGQPRLLVFSKTMGFEHASIPKGIEALEKLGRKNGFEIDTTKNAALFTDENLAQYSAIIFLSTTGNVLDAKQEAAFERYIQAGGGYVGIHAATDTEYDWGWYNNLVGAQFLSHPVGTPEADFIIKNRTHTATAFFTDTLWHRTDELYNFKRLNKDVKVLMTVDETSYEGGENGNYHPMAWYHEYDGGRAFYTAGGHTDESYAEELFLKHLLGGIEYAIGDNLVLDYKKATSQFPPEADRFSKVALTTGAFFEPTEMAVLPNNDVLIAQRRGEVLLFSDATQSMEQLAFLQVYHKAETEGVNVEEGLMGLQKDPNYAKNHWIYLYYAPAGDTWVNRLSRFKYKDGNFDLDTEQIILEVDSDREVCCHTGGSIAFGPKGLLYLSTGDNSTPFDEPNAPYVNRGYAPLNDLPNKAQYDARRSSGNTNDLRGKILRIKVNEDGSYDIPKGNLFPVGTEKTRPEIYTMGHRNPYRISVDKKRGYLYWGDIGPDAAMDSLATRGPRGYDELNQARGPGNFGWPLFIGDNYAYHDYDYATGQSGGPFDPQAPINDSKNNTGLIELPPAQPAFAYYPYAATGNFPQLASGSRNAMAGPTYWSKEYPNGGGLPPYYDGKPIVYDWMRGWMMAVHLFEDGSFNKMEPFAPQVPLNNLIDIEMGPNGRMYLLEYGSGWFSPNADSGLGYIEFNSGNRPPVLDGFSVDNDSGKLPLTINANVLAHDREGDAIRYTWDFGDGTVVESDATVTHTYQDEGSYQLSVTATDTDGNAVTSLERTVVAGNQRPLVSINLEQANASFYVPGRPIAYKVSVSDPDGEVDTDNIYVSSEYRSGMDQANQDLGHKQVSGAIMGKALAENLDCRSCHAEQEASIGPSYMSISEKYTSDKNATNYLITKIIEGGSGVWGPAMMPAHPNVTQNEARQIAQYIGSLTGKASRAPSLPLKGTIIPEANKNGGRLLLRASYTDGGMGPAMPLTGSNTVILASNSVIFPKGTPTEGMQAVTFNDMQLQLMNQPQGWLQMQAIDLTGVSMVLAVVGWQEPPNIPYTMQLRSGSPHGALLGSGTFDPKTASGQGGAIAIPIKATNGIQEELYLTYKAQGSEITVFALVQLQFN